MLDKDYYLKLEEERRMTEVKNAIAEKLVDNPNPSNNLKIAFLLKWVIPNGGTKIIFETSNRLTMRGHKIFLICHDEKPDWYPLANGIEYISVAYDKVLSESIPKDVDIIVCATNTCIYEAINQKIAPVVYFEQGSHHLFNRNEVDGAKLEFIAKEIGVCNNIYTVSNYAKEKISLYYNKDSVVIPNAVDDKVFYYDASRKNNKKITISAIGPEDWDFKGLKYILEAVKLLQNEYDFEFNWITPRVPTTEIDNTFVNPPQALIGEVLRKTDIFISASEFESFCLPVLEAMTCGCAVVTTNAGGNMEFSVDNETCLIVEKRNTMDIVNKVKSLINNKELREKLQSNALNVSKKYNWDNTIYQVEQYYKQISKYTVKK